jgi:hypothetical protein
MPIEENKEVKKLDPSTVAQKRKYQREQRKSSRLLISSGSQSGGASLKIQSDTPENKDNKDKGKPKGFLDYGEELRTFTITRPEGDYEFLDYVRLSFQFDLDPLI